MFQSISSEAHKNILKINLTSLEVCCYPLNEQILNLLQYERNKIRLKLKESNGSEVLATQDSLTNKLFPYLNLVSRMQYFFSMCCR